MNFSISGWWPIELSNASAFSDLELPIINILYGWSRICRSSHWRCFINKVVLKFFSQENTCARVSFLITLEDSARSSIKIETLAEAFSCEFFFKKTFFTKHLLKAASKFVQLDCVLVYILFLVKSLLFSLDHLLEYDVLDGTFQFQVDVLLENFYNL